MSEDQPAPGRRDPEGRRRRIITAAAEILLDEGPDAFTHRAVAARAGVSLGSTTRYFTCLEELREAALTRLSQEMEESLAEIAVALAEGGGGVDEAIEMMHQYLTDTRQVRSTLAMMNAAACDPDLRSLAMTWSDRLTQILSGHVGGEAATAVVLFLDGAAVHAALRGFPIGAELLRRAVLALVEGNR